jgi:diadenosine tetraphosphate (Ap4A) HIT family hydrolase
MYDEQTWTALVQGTECPLCQSPERAVVAVLPSGRVELVNDADFVGYSVLVYHRHAIELYDLNQEERRQLIEDVARVAQAIAGQCRPAKFNYEILGNVVPHLHCHIIPRYPDDGYWGGPLWWRPVEKRRELSRHEYEALADTLRAALLG